MAFLGPRLGCEIACSLHTPLTFRVYSAQDSNDSTYVSYVFPHTKINSLRTSTTLRFRISVVRRDYIIVEARI